MNLLMILIIVAAVWACAAICYFAWRLMPDENAPEPPESTSSEPPDPASKDAGD